MQLTNKVKFIILLIGLTVFGIFILFISRGGQQVTKPGGFPPPSIPAVNNQKFTVESQIKESDFKFPTTLPILQISSTTPLTLQESKDIASKFGFTNDPQVLKDTITGTFYLWTNQTASLDITAKTRAVKYSLNSPVLGSPKKLTESELVANANNFLFTKGLINDNNVESFVNYYKLANPSDFESRVTTNIQDATFAWINFSINSGGYKILTLDPTKSPITVKVFPDGTITEIDLVVFGNITQSSQTFPLKNFNDFQTNLNKASIISLQDGNIINPDPQTYKIQSVIVDSVDLVYLAQEGNTYFQPVFLIKGTATITNLGDVSAYLYLNALK